MKIKQKIFEIIYKPESNNGISKKFETFIIIMIVLNVIAVIAGSFDNLGESTNVFLEYFELVSVYIFTLEYLLRFWTSDFLFSSHRFPRIKFMFSFLPLIDLFAILPFYLPLLITLDLRFIRILRLFRLFRVFKLNRYNNSMEIIWKVLKNEKEKLISTIFVTSILIIFASSMMYYVENDVQPDKFPNIIASMWWAVATLTTVGYGDVYPITILGKLLSGFIAILGIGLVALPTGIISSGFIGEVSKKKEKKRFCPYCKKEID